ncbi:MAG: response regulator [Rhodospirillales bacterium]|nr:response regulator [Rhodospirillales bacterium]
MGIVDDDPAVLESLCFLLDVAGYPAEGFASVADFLARRDAGRLAGLILDHHMPVVTGLELLARLRAAGETVPVLLITGSPSPAIVARAEALGVTQVLEKPPLEGDLLAFVERVLA